MFILFFIPLLAVMGWDDALIIGGIAAAVGGGSAWFNGYNSKKQLSRDAKKNYLYSLMMAQNGPSASVKGLRKAGLNPILAATDGSFATPSMPSVHSNPVDADFGGALGTAMQMRQTDSNIELQKSTADLNDANAKLAGVKAANELANRGLTGDYAAISRVLSSFGLDDKTIKSILPAFSKQVFHSIKDGISVPNGSVRSSAAVKQDHVAEILEDEGLSKPLPKEERIYDDLVREEGREAAHAKYLRGEKIERYRRRKRELNHRRSPIFTR